MRKFYLSLLSLFFLAGCSTVQVPSAYDQPACTQEAKLCPDGSYVVRVSPDCQFDACPKTLPPSQQDIDRWKTVDDEVYGFYFQYPDPLEANYIRLLTEQEYKPSITISDAGFSCQTLQPSEAGGLIEQEKKQINGHDYCVHIQSDAAAGTNYLTYTYVTLFQEKLISLKFTLGEVNCLNYDLPQQSECQEERSQFNPDSLASQIIGTLSFNVFFSQ